MEGKSRKRKEWLGPLMDLDFTPSTNSQQMLRPNSNGLHPLLQVSTNNLSSISPPSNQQLKQQQQETMIKNFSFIASERLFNMDLKMYRTNKWTKQLNKLLVIVKQHAKTCNAEAEKFVEILLSNCNPTRTAEDHIVILATCIDVISLPELQPVQLSQFTDLLIQELMNEVVRQAPLKNGKMQKIKRKYLSLTKMKSSLEQVVSPTTSTSGHDNDYKCRFVDLQNQLFQFEDIQCIQQTQKQIELLDLFYKSTLQTKIECFLEFCTTPVSCGGTMPGLKLVLWTLCDMLECIDIIPPSLGLELSKLFIKLINNSSKTNFNEMVSMRQALNNSKLSGDVFVSIDEVAERRYPKNNWNELVQNSYPLSRLHYLNATPEEKQVMHDIVIEFKMRNTIQQSPPSSINYFNPQLLEQKETLPNQHILLESQQLQQKPPQFSFPTLDISVTSNDPCPSSKILLDEPTENCVDYDHFDRRMLFCPVSYSSEESDDDQEDKNKYQKRPPPVIAPLTGMEEFLKSCREEAVQIQKEKIEGKSSSSSFKDTPKSNSRPVVLKKSTTNENRKRHLDDDLFAETIKKQGVQKKEADEIQRLIIKVSNAVFNSRILNNSSSKITTK